MFKKFLFKQMMQKQGLSDTDQEKILNLYEKDPDLFKTLASEVAEKIKTGTDQKSAVLEISQKYEERLKKLEE